MTIGDAASGRPCVDRHLHLRRHGRSPNATVLSDKIDDAPPSIALLDVRERQRRYFRSPEPTAEKYRKNGAIA